MNMDVARLVAFCSAECVISYAKREQRLADSVHWAVAIYG